MLKGDIMENQTPVQVARVKEKIAIAKKLGMKRWADVHEFTDANFPRITHDEIHDKLGHRWFREFDPETFIGGMFGIAFFDVVVGGLMSVGSHPNHTLPAPWIIAAIIAAELVALVAASYFHRVQISTCDIEEWEDNLPYGAMLAMAEADKRGYDDFTVHYPSKLYHARIKDDPIITAKRKIDKVWDNKRYEIFAWDDGKLYE